MDFDFPEDLLFLILTRLPVLSLLRFRCVSKLWYALITSPEFIVSHLNHQIHNQASGNYYVLLTKMLHFHVRELYSLHVDNERFQEIETFRFPVREPFIVGCVNGLICLDAAMNKSCKSPILWNPSIKKAYVLPTYVINDDEPPPLINDDGTTLSRRWLLVCHTCFGFGYDVVSNDFKVVSIIGFATSLNRSLNRHDLNYDTRTCYAVFSVATKSWKTINFTSQYYPCSYSCNVGNFVYRIAAVVDVKVKVIGFDLNSDEFTVFDLPKCEKPVRGRATHELTNFRGSLGLFRGWDWRNYEIWARKEDGAIMSWMKLFSIKIDGGNPLRHNIIGFTRRGAVLVSGDVNLIVTPGAEDALLVKYVPSTTQQVHSFTESLALLEEGVDLSLINN